LPDINTKLAKIEERLDDIEAKLKLAGYGLSGLRWVLGIGVAATVVAFVNGWIN